MSSSTCCCCGFSVGTGTRFIAGLHGVSSLPKTSEPVQIFINRGIATLSISLETRSERLRRLDGHVNFHGVRAATQPICSFDWFCNCVEGLAHKREFPQHDEYESLSTRSAGNGMADGCSTWFQEIFYAFRWLKPMAVPIVVLLVGVAKPSHAKFSSTVFNHFSFGLSVAVAFKWR